MKFSELVRALREKGLDFAVSGAAQDPDLSEIFQDSRKVLPGSLFCCIKGEKNDGHAHIPAVRENGALALLCEHPVDSDLPCILAHPVQDRSIRELAAEAAVLLYGEPASKLLMAGITGTNGKSTTSYILRAILEAGGLKTGLLGTIIEYDGLRERDAERTTPEACDIQRLLATMVKNGCKACVMEVSSHGLQFGRLNGCAFDNAVFTNLNPEHLDFHGDMENYYQAKRLLFTRYAKAHGVGAVNADDPYARRILEEFPQTTRGFAVSSEDADVTVKDVRLDMNGSSFTVESRGMPDLRVESPLVGTFNVSNVLAAVTVLRQRFDDRTLAAGVAQVPQVPGRLEKHTLPNGACCFIDFAHTPEALRNVLSTVRAFCAGKLISVFGHGGGRYSSNRQALGKIAASLADRVIVTMDNPRDEDPAEIADSIVQGIASQGQGTKYQVILDRKEAIFTALSIAGPEDVLVVSGKGPEKYLILKDQKIPHSDAATVEEWKKLSA